MKNFIFIGILIFVAIMLAKACDNKIQSNMRAIDPTYGKSMDQIRSEIKEQDSKKSVWERNQDFAHELDRMETARQLDRMEEERREINKYRKYKD